MFNTGQSHGSGMLSLFKHRWAKNRIVDKLLVEDERQNQCGKSLLLWCIYPYSDVLPVCGQVWVWLDPSPWCWELVSKCLRSKTPWCEVGGDHWLKIKCLQENQLRWKTTGPNLQQVTGVIPQRPLTPLFTQGGIQYLSSWQIAHMEIRYLCKPVPGFPQGTFPISWVDVNHWCIFKIFGPCNEQGKDYLGWWLCPDMPRRGEALQALLHKSQSSGTKNSQALDSPAKPWARAPVLLMGLAESGVASSSAIPPWPDIILLNVLGHFSELLEAIFLLGNAISTKPCKSMEEHSFNRALQRLWHCPVPLEWAVHWLDSLAWSVANLWP